MTNTTPAGTAAVVKSLKEGERKSTKIDKQQKEASKK